MAGVQDGAAAGLLGDPGHSVAGVARLAKHLPVQFQHRIAPEDNHVSPLPAQAFLRDAPGLGLRQHEDLLGGSGGRVGPEHVAQDTILVDIGDDDDRVDSGSGEGCGPRG
jgi:hypothetical protein